MSDFAPHDLMSALPWRRAVFTTYALSLSFFEAVILDALTRGRAQDATIFADISGVRAALGEQGARRAGRDYQIEPFAVETGVFPPKITALSAEDDCHLLVGSGNLTFGGWGGNLEVVEHLHPSFAADAFDDAAEFFELLASRPGIRHDANQMCEAIVGDLRGGAERGRRNGDIRLLHNLDGAIGEKLVGFADDLGGATRLVAASPYWTGSALDRLCGQLQLSEAYVHSHPAGAVRGRMGANWPIGAKSGVRPVLVDILLDDESPRPLHAKMFEIVCKRGRIVLSGSANATSAALSSGSNVEACVIRIDRQASTGWTVDPTSAPEPMEASDDGDDEEDLTGVLRAVLSDDRIKGRILHPLMVGPAQIFQVTSNGPVLLGTADLDAQSTFEIPAPILELLSWSGGRLIVRVEGEDGAAAEGFVSIVSFAEIRRRIGNMAPRLFALLSGTETPTDVAAIMSWFYEDPKRLLSPRITGRQRAGFLGDTSAMVSVADLVSGRAALAERSHEEPISSVGWKRFIDSVIAAFRTPRKPFSSASSGISENDDDDDATEITTTDPAIDKSLATFGRLFDLLLASEHAGQHSLVALDLAQYVSVRLQPDPAMVKSWLDRALRALVGHDMPSDRTADVIAAALVMHGSSPQTGDDRSARLRLLRLGADFSGAVPGLAGVEGFISILGPSVDYQAVWQRLQLAKSLPEQARAYLDALQTGTPSDGYPDLPMVAAEAWPTMEQAILDEDFRGDIIELDQPMRACPRHHRVLPVADFVELQDVRVTIARDCCGRVLVCRGL